MTLISVIIPVKNEALNIGRCLRSLPKETEAVVIDNYSTDRTVAIAQKLSAKVFQKGPERSSQRNFGAQKAKGKFLLFLDADMSLNQPVSEEIEKITRTQNKTQAFIIPEISQGKNYWAQVRALEKTCYLNEKTIESPRLFTKKIFEKAGGYHPDLVAGEDWDLTARVQKFTSLGRLKNSLIHHEENFKILPHLKKKAYYAKKIRPYLKKHPRLFKNQSGRHRLKIFFKNWPRLIKKPHLALGLFFLKFLEYFTYLLNK